MSGETNSNKARRIYKRKFDWNDARVMRAEGMTYAEIAACVGVSVSTVHLACNSKSYDRQLHGTTVWKKSARPMS